MYRIALFILLGIGLTTDGFNQISRTNQLQSRSSINPFKPVSVDQPIKVKLKIMNVKTNEPIAFATIILEDLNLEWQANELGIVEFELPANHISNLVNLELKKRRYFSKSININVEDRNEVNKTIRMKYNRHSGCFTVHGCPSF